LHGSIPSAGWHNLEFIDLSHNSFTDFPFIELPGAPNLESLNLAENRLVSIPGDDAFANMTNLSYFKVDDNANLSGPVPALWNNPQSKISYFHATHCNFSGTLPPFRASKLMVVDLDGNKICGSLPEVLRPVHMDTLRLSQNRLQGTIPSSWVSKLGLTYLLNLAGNLLEGTIPRYFLPEFPARTISALLLQANYFHGPLFNMSMFQRINLLNISGSATRFDACDFDPSFSNSIGQCIMPSLYFGCECASFYTECPRISCPPQTGPPTTEAPFDSIVTPPAYECTNPPSRPIWGTSPSQPISPTATCPPPAPSPDFTCINGIWQAPASVIVPTLTIPPGSTVIIAGNLTVGGDLVLEGNDITIEVGGCFFLSGDGQIIVTLTEEQIKQLESEKGGFDKILMKTGNSDCPNSVDLSNVVVVAKPLKKSCKRVETERGSESNRSTLAVIFKVDSSRCNVWWIVLVSVLGLALLVMIGVILLALFHPTACSGLKPLLRASK
jgi:hypothetical protein